ncbi:MAG: hypothetical protein LBB25_02410 [Holosporaceae bacterium]|jgi:MtN3 and saliva related transmembrane protein|nr:hypothetical protein [Holosporaceae bacterium]
MKDYFVWAIEIIFGIGMFLNAILFIPQAIKIYNKKNSDGLSVVTFIGFNIVQLSAVFHGYIHEDLILMFGSMLSFFLCGVVTFLITFYKR